MGTLVFQATLGGQVNLNGPNTASTFNIAVPATTGTMVTTGDTGSVSSTMLANSLSLVTPALGTPASGVMTNVTGLPISTGVSGLGTGVATALAVNTGSAGAFVLYGGALGTPTSGTLTNATGLPLSTGVTGTLPVANGGTGLTSTPANGALDIGNGTGFTRTTLTAGSNITITNAAGSITIASSGGGPQIQPISASVASSALTISASALSLDFRSTTLGSGTVTTVSGTPSNLVVPSTATLGTVSAVQSRLVVIALNNAGTIELAVVNISGGNNLDETTLLTTTAISAGATSASVVYSTTARTSVAFRVIGYIESTQATAGTWATAPSTIQGYGGQALSAMSSVGYSQTWQAFTFGTNRISGTTYYNTTGRPIQVLINGSGVGGTFFVNGIKLGTWSGVAETAQSAIVPPGGTYVATANSLLQWSELR